MDNIASDYVTSSTGIDFTQNSSDTNGKGLYIRSGTEANAYPIYYYRGDVEDNNVIFGGFCWKIVRTTETGGVKMIYNGVPVEGACDNTGTASEIGTSVFNTNYNSPAYVGYMYGDVYEADGRDMNGDTTVYYYGNSVTYENGVYTLTNTITSDWSSVWETGLNNYHYTCFSTGTTCNEVYYLTYTNETYAYYLTLTDVASIEDALENMLDKNATSSTIKGNATTSGSIDYWYYNNLNSYTSSLEDTIFCNDRSIWNLGAFNPTGGLLNSEDGIFEALIFEPFGRMFDTLLYGTTYEPSLSCSRDVDKFTVSSSNGNGVLDYPVGLLTLDEVAMAGLFAEEANEDFYLYTGSDYWLGSPGGVVGGSAGGSDVDSDGTLVNDAVDNAFGLRPVVSLRLGIGVSGGSGTVADPYVIES